MILRCKGSVPSRELSHLQYLTVRTTAQAAGKERVLCLTAKRRSRMQGFHGMLHACKPTAGGHFQVVCSSSAILYRVQTSRLRLWTARSFVSAQRAQGAEVCRQQIACSRRHDGVQVRQLLAVAQLMCIAVEPKLVGDGFALKD